MPINFSDKNCSANTFAGSGIFKVSIETGNLGAIFLNLIALIYNSVYEKHESYQPKPSKISRVHPSMMC